VEQPEGFINKTKGYWLLAENAKQTNSVYGVICDARLFCRQLNDVPRSLQLLAEFVGWLQNDGVMHQRTNPLLQWWFNALDLVGFASGA